MRSAALAGLAAGCASAGPEEEGAGQERPNIVLVALDTVRWDHTSLAGYARDTTPNLARLAQMPGSTTFTRAYATASWSLPAYASVFTGRSALSHGVGFTRPTMDAGHRTLAEILQIYGYETQAFCSSAHLHPKMGLNRGFDGYKHNLPLMPLTPQVNAALRWLDQRAPPAEGGRPPEGAAAPAEPFFLFIQGYDAHVPYPAPAMLSGMFEEEGSYCSKSSCQRDCGPGARGGDWRCARMGEGGSGKGPRFEHIVAHYDTSLFNADYQLGRLLHELGERGLLDSSILIVMADHGEGLGEAGAFAHDWECGEPVFHVPLVVRLPNGAAAARYEGVVSLDSLLPTLLEELQIPPLGDIDGSSFGAALQRPLPDPDPAALARSASKGCYAVTDREWQAMAIWDTAGQAAWTLHRPGDAADLAAGQPETLTRLQQAVVDWPLGLDLEEINQEPAKGDPALQDALKQGGYWSKPEGKP